MSLPANTERESFSTTAWELVKKAAGDGEALSKIIQRYRPPLLAYLVHCKKLQIHDAEDVLQDFLTEKVIGSRILDKADQHRGRFRSFLLSCLDNFVTSHFRAAAADKRTPDRGPRFEDSSFRLDPASPSDGDVFETAWAVNVLGQTLLQMRNECLSSERPDLWGIFEARELAVIFGAEPTPYEALMMQWGFPSEKTAMNAAGTARLKFQRLLDAVLAEQSESPVEDQLREFRQALECAGTEWLDRLRTALWNGVIEVSISGSARPQLDAGRMDFVVERSKHSNLPEDVLHELLGAAQLFELVEMPPKLAARLQSAMMALSSHTATLHGVLCHGDPGIDILVLIKDVAKQQRASVDRSIPESVATVLYYACIARALTLYNRRISSADELTLRKGFTWVVDQSWVDDWLLNIARDGLRVLQTEK